MKKSVTLIYDLFSEILGVNAKKGKLVKFNFSD